MEIETTNHDLVELKEGEVFELITITCGGVPEYEIYFGDEFKDEMGNMFHEFQLVQPSLLNYLLLRLRWLPRKGIIRYAECKIDEDGDLIESSYATEVNGSYKCGTYKVTIHDEYMQYLDDDSIHD